VNIAVHLYSISNCFSS